MTIVVTGGGSGGHITPILAVAHELKRQKPGLTIVYIGQKGDKLIDIPAADPAIDAIHTVSAGKFRRYHGEGWKQLLDIPTQAKNIRDAFRVLAGTVQSYLLLRKLKPSIIFTRGGFVSVPVALGGKLNGIPYITHDSDSLPSLANRVIARWASLHTVALPEDVYPYPRDKTQMVGIPLAHEYVHVTSALQTKYRQELGLDKFKQILFVTGGGNGARDLNEAVIDNVHYLLKRYPELCIVHVAGRIHETAVSTAYDSKLAPEARTRVMVHGFLSGLYKYIGASDVIISRAGATNLAEYAVQGKACIIVPAEQLVGGHQIENAKVLEQRSAIVLMTQAQADQERRLATVVGELLDDADKRSDLGKHLHEFARTDAAKELAVLLLERAKSDK
jgi:UDP-N-acetylglucosamine--N-acetylmuramyl-(pentapeptide) pyrophosphoryl-undecaprenol N-acetylglucosamine transferase